MTERNIPSTGEQLPVIGLGTWATFDVAGRDKYGDLTEVLNAMNAAGGALIDSSPMYGRAEQVIGELTEGTPTQNDFFYATKVWTTGRKEGIVQMEDSMRKMKRGNMDLMQIHNLVDWKTHLKTLQEWKEAGKIRYIGITHYTDQMHAALEDVFTKETIDFVQFNYSIDARHAEERLLKAAADHGVGTIINRPFGVSGAFKKLNGTPLPAWAMDAGMHTWSAFFLAYIISHPAVTCVIPATANPAHAKENFSVGDIGYLSEGLRKKMVALMKGV